VTLRFLFEVGAEFTVTVCTTERERAVTEVGKAAARGALSKARLLLFGGRCDGSPCY
jgi:hypothetical protein